MKSVKANSKLYRFWGNNAIDVWIWIDLNSRVYERKRTFSKTWITRMLFNSLKWSWIISWMISFWLKSWFEDESSWKNPRFRIMFEWPSERPSLQFQSLKPFRSSEGSWKACFIFTRRESSTEIWKWVTSWSRTPGRNFPWRKSASSNRTMDQRLNSQALDCLRTIAM